MSTKHRHDELIRQWLDLLAAGVPEPERDPKHGESYWAVYPLGKSWAYRLSYQCGDDWHELLRDRGLLHRTEEDARTAAQAMVPEREPK